MEVILLIANFALRATLLRARVSIVPDGSFYSDRNRIKSISYSS